MTEDQMSHYIFDKFGKMVALDESARKYAAREVPVVANTDEDVDGDGRLDVVGYDKEKRTFQVVECKSGDGAAAIRQAFTQLACYRGMIEHRVLTFLNSFTQKSPMRFERLMEATSGGKQIAVEFYVGLTDEACQESVSLLRRLKERYPHTGILRVKPDGRIRHDVKEANGTYHPELAQAVPVLFDIPWPPEPEDGAVPDSENRLLR